jgi:hypothetical protein
VHCLDQMMRPQKHTNKVSNHSMCSMCSRCSPPKIITMANGGRASRQTSCTHMIFNNNNGSEQQAVIASHLVCRLSDATTTAAIRVRVRSSSRWGSHELLPTRPQQALDFFDRCRAEHLSALRSLTLVRACVRADLCACAQSCLHTQWLYRSYIGCC